MRSTALLNGSRGLPGGETLLHLLVRHRGIRHVRHRPLLSAAEIWKWAKAFKRRHGQWPTHKSGPVEDAPGEKWSAIEIALSLGRRGLPGSTSLAKFIRDGGVLKRYRRHHHPSTGRSSCVR